MRTAALCLSVIVLFPLLAFASVEPKDKYICNCHITPGIPWKVKPVVHHHAHAAKPAKKTEAKKEEEPKPKPPENDRVQIQPPPKVAHTTGSDDGRYPGRANILSSNKLALPAGKSIYAPGELVYISGRVLDKQCVPVSDAIVEIWQTNSEGKYVKSTLGELLSPAPSFASTGRAVTDNLGRFNFVTVFPGTAGGRAPYIHVHVVHKDFPTLETEMFFADDRRNAEDPVYSSLEPQQRSMVTAKVWERDVNDPDKGLAASWDISLNGKNLWRHF